MLHQAVPLLGCRFTNSTLCHSSLMQKAMLLIPPTPPLSTPVKSKCLQIKYTPTVQLYFSHLFPANFGCQLFPSPRPSSLSLHCSCLSCQLIQSPCLPRANTPRPALPRPSLLSSPVYVCVRNGARVVFFFLFSDRPVSP